MVALRRISMRRFRGFDAFETTFGEHAVLVGEPGAGRTDLVDGLVRVLDPDSLRGRDATELDFFDLDRTRVAEVEVVIGAFPTIGLGALTTYAEVWERDAGVLRTVLPRGVDFDPDKHELVVRLAHRLEDDGGELVETVHWPKYADDAAGLFRRATAIERRQLPFFWQRGSSVRGVDLSQRGEFMALAIAEPSGDLRMTIESFVAAIETASAAFSATDPVASALTKVLEGLRDVRRFDPTAPASDLLSFMPDGGAPSGILRSLSPAVTLTDGPERLPATRHGGTAGAALRFGLLQAAALAVPGAIVVVDDIGGEFDPHLARHFATGLRLKAGQLIAGTRTTAVVEAFAPSEIVRLSRDKGVRVASFLRPTDKPGRTKARHLIGSLLGALSASTVVLVEGMQDRHGLVALADRARQVSGAPSLDGSGIAIAYSPSGDGALQNVAAAARTLGLYTIVVLDNDRGSPANAVEIVQNCVDKADAVIRLPNRMALEEALLVDVPDADLIATWRDLAAGVEVTLEAGWDTRSGKQLVAALSKALHAERGVLHGTYVWALPAASLPPVGLAILDEIRRLANDRTPVGLVELTWPSWP
jgi:putative ATP-dependent endonuclease of the OLD family